MQYQLSKAVIIKGLMCISLAPQSLVALATDVVVKAMTETPVLLTDTMMATSSTPIRRQQMANALGRNMPNS